MWAEAVHDILSSRFWIFQVSIETYVLMYFFLSQDSSGEPIQGCLNPQFSGELCDLDMWRSQCFSTDSCWRWAWDDLFCLSVCSGDEDAPDGNYRQSTNSMKTRPSSHHRTLAGIWTLCWDVNTSLSPPPNASVILRLLLPLKHCIEKHTKCFLCLFFIESMKIIVNNQHVLSFSFK